MRGEQTPRWKPAIRQSSVQVEEVGESVGPLSPVCPGGPRVCAGRNPAESPTPSSQTPGSYCFSPFGCPARGANTGRYLHWGHSRSLLSSTNPLPKDPAGPAQISPNFPGSQERVHVNVYLLASCCHLLSDHLSSAAL